MKASETARKIYEEDLLEELVCILCEIRNGRILLTNNYKYLNEIPTRNIHDNA